MKNQKLVELGYCIRIERMKRNITQEYLAEVSNLSIRTISDIERGITDIRYTNLLQIADALNLTLADLTNLNSKFNN